MSPNESPTDRAVGMDPPWCFSVPSPTMSEAAWLSVVDAARAADPSPQSVARINEFFTRLDAAARLFGTGCFNFWSEMSENPNFLNRTYAAKTVAWAEAYRDLLVESEQLAVRFGSVPQPLATYIAEVRPNVLRGIEVLRGIHLADDDPSPRC